MGTRTLLSCSRCGQGQTPVAAILGVCIHCIRQDFEKVKPALLRAHTLARAYLRRVRLGNTPLLGRDYAV